MVGNLQILSKESNYMEWMEKFTNALDQVRPGMGKLIRNINRFIANAAGHPISCIPIHVVDVTSASAQRLLTASS